MSCVGKILSKDLFKLFYQNDKDRNPIYAATYKWFIEGDCGEESETRLEDNDDSLSPAAAKVVNCLLNLYIIFC